MGRFKAQAGSLLKAVAEDGRTLVITSNGTAAAVVWLDGIEYDGNVDYVDGDGNIVWLNGSGFSQTGLQWRLTDPSIKHKISKSDLAIFLADPDKRHRVRIDTGQIDLSQPFDASANNLVYIVKKTDVRSIKIRHREPNLFARIWWHLKLPNF